MKYTLTLASVLVFVLISLTIQPAQAQGGSTYTVQTGDTLSSISYAYGISAEELLAANGLTWGTWLFEGQKLIIPIGMTSPIEMPRPFNEIAGSSETTVPLEVTGPTYSSPPLATVNPISSSYNQQIYYQPDQTQMVTVQPGDTLFSIATQFGVGANELAAANGINWGAWVYSGQQLIIPTQSPAYTAYNQPDSPASIVQPEPQTMSSGKRWIDVDLTNQTVTAYEGQVPVYNAVVSTGTWKYPTVAGTYKIYVKYEKARMRGGFGAEAYDLPDVPYVMYFYKGYGLHGTYWHNNFGTPMSHGCVNLSIADAEWFFNWASVGTRVVTHY